VEDRIRRLVTSQPYAVLCTHGDDHAYGSLVAFAFADDLRTAVFATPVATRKYRLLSEHDRIALVVDDRPDRQARMMEVAAVTVTGRARELAAGPERDACARRLLARHPQLASFVAADSCALFEVAVLRCFHVTRFQEVTLWVPSSR
jgi:nitroimidazol reductase NimA-like FMN-containing flavoprotein (pyridoxamine 5'-phosphate oxidase superfamily)